MPFAQATPKGSMRQLSQPLQMKANGKKHGLLKKGETDQLSEVDEEEEKKMANAFTEVKQKTVYRGNRKTTVKGRVPYDASIMQNNDDNQSVMADWDLNCETNRVSNDNYRLDMTWAQQE